MLIRHPYGCVPLVICSYRHTTPEIRLKDTELGVRKHRGAVGMDDIAQKIGLG